MSADGGGPSHWTFGQHHSSEQWRKKMRQRGWTPEQIGDAIREGARFAANNLVRPENPATRYVHPSTGRSVVLDDVTAEVIHVGGDGFVY